MKIILTSLTLTNFKGARNRVVNFFEDVTDIYGKNESGKSTIFDAFLWTLFDKDSSNNSKFNIKPLDENNEPYHRLDHEVKAIVQIDGSETEIKKVLREKWTKPRGSNTAVFDGHETSYFWNGVPLKLKEFQTKVSELINETTFKMISNPLYFNTAIDWPVRRSTLLSIAGTIDDATIVASNTKLFAGLMQQLNGRKTMDELKKQVAAEKKTIRDEIESIPSRIDEAKRLLPDTYDYDLLEKEITSKKTLIHSVEEMLQNKTQAEKQHQESVSALLKQKNTLVSELTAIEFEAQESVKTKARERVKILNEELSKVEELEIGLKNEETALTADMAKKSTATTQRENLIAEWKNINAEQLVFNDDDFCCPTCKRAFEEADIDTKKEELTNNFNKKKSERLTANIEAGTKLKETIELLAKSIANRTANITTIKNSFTEQQEKLAILKQENTRLSGEEEEQAWKLLAVNTVYQSKMKAKQDLQEKIDTPFQADQNQKQLLLENKSQYTAELQELLKQLNTREQKQKIETRVAELEKSENEMAQKLADLEATEYAIQEFNKTKMDTLENRVNGMFKIVSFKMFEQQINEGLKDTCVAMVNGVPFADLNTAAKINAGLDIINTLQKHFDTYVPVFIDNRESVTEIQPMQCQVINLVVSPQDAKLRVQNGALATAEA